MLYADTIGVLTFHRCINYGSYWQARCLVDGLRGRGYNAVLMEHTSGEVNRAEWRCALDPVQPTRTPKSDHAFYRRKLVKFIKACASLPRSRRFDLEKPGEMEEYDLVIVGSDEVWNLRHPWYGGYPLFYGSGVRAKRLVSYAASFGSYHASEGLGLAWAERLRKFDSISVRDENSQMIIKEALDRDSAIVLDPCLQFPWFTAVGGNGRYTPYIAVYGHNFSEWFTREVTSFARGQGLVLVSVGYRNDWADHQWITAGPDEFAHCIENAVTVATNFFHGCIFALAYAKPFVSELAPYRFNKVESLVRSVGAEEHLMTERSTAADYAKAMGERLDAAILDRIAALRLTSDAYLQNILES